MKSERQIFPNPKDEKGGVSSALTFLPHPFCLLPFILSGECGSFMVAFVSYLSEFSPYLTVSIIYLKVFCCLTFSYACNWPNRDQLSLPDCFHCNAARSWQRDLWRHIVCIPGFCPPKQGGRLQRNFLTWTKKVILYIYIWKYFLLAVDRECTLVDLNKGLSLTDVFAVYWIICIGWA